MEKYNYLEAIEEDVRTYIEDEVNLDDYSSRDELENYLNEHLFCEDSVTGNASGSYYCDAWEAEEAICHNMDLLKEALEELGSDTSMLDSAESCDVTIRCYLLSQAISNVLDEMDLSFDDEDNDK